MDELNLSQAELISCVVVGIIAMLSLMLLSFFLYKIKFFTHAQFVSIMAVSTAGFGIILGLLIVLGGLKLLIW